MKKVIEIDENEGLESLLGEKVTLLCANYFYTGKLMGVDTECVLLKDPEIVYETGPWTDEAYKDAQALPTEKLYIQKGAIEAFGKLK